MKAKAPPIVFATVFILVALIPVYAAMSLVALGIHIEAKADYPRFLFYFGLSSSLMAVSPVIVYGFARRRIWARVSLAIATLFTLVYWTAFSLDWPTYDVPFVGRLVGVIGLYFAGLWFDRRMRKPDVVAYLRGISVDDIEEVLE